MYLFVVEGKIQYSMKHFFVLSSFLIIALCPEILFSQGNAGTITITPASGSATSAFSEFFLPKTLRIDFIMAGNKNESTVFFSSMRQEPHYGGPRKNLVDPYNYGSFRITATDSVTGRLIFSKGFCNLFQEWQGTVEAKKIKKAYSQTAILPFPLKTILFRIEKRNNTNGQFSSLYEMYINPKSYFIARDEMTSLPFVKFRDSGDPQDKADIAFIAEGYTKDEMPKFLEDAKRLSDSILAIKPFSEFKDRFNFYAIESPSADQGITVPGKGIYANTALKSTFYTFDMDRYLTTSDAWPVYDVAANVPYDAIFLVVNSKIYGGGGFFNYYAESTADNFYAPKVAIHEFGHSFAGLADEYVDLTISYTDYYNPAVEPWEPNITDNVDFGSKWKSQLTPGIPIPTPDSPQYDDAIGMFEGAGYVEKGFYRSQRDCRMRSNEAAGFCAACQDAIRRMIKFYSE